MEWYFSFYVFHSLGKAHMSKAIYFSPLSVAENKDTA